MPTPKSYMVLGAMSGIVMALAAIMVDVSIFVVPCFAAGMVFGKGYGIWEERQK